MKRTWVLAALLAVGATIPAAASFNSWFMYVAAIGPGAAGGQGTTIGVLPYATDGIDPDLPLLGFGEQLLGEAPPFPGPMVLLKSTATGSYLDIRSVVDTHGGYGYCPWCGFYHWLGPEPKVWRFEISTYYNYPGAIDLASIDLVFAANNLAGDPMADLGYPYTYAPQNLRFTWSGNFGSQSFKLQQMGQPIWLQNVGTGTVTLTVEYDPSSIYNTAEPGSVVGLGGGLMGMLAFLKRRRTH